MDKIKFYSDLLATWVVILGALISGSFALVQYYNNSSAERAKVTLGYVERFNHPPLQDAQFRLEKFWNERAEEVYAQNQISETALTNFVINNIRKSELDDDIYIIVGFYEDLHACMCGKVCDEALAMRFFGKSSFDFYSLLLPYLANQRQRLSDNSFGLGIELFAKAQRTKRIDAKLFCSV